MEFDKIEKLEEYLVSDSKRSTINPVRFVNVESIDMWVKVKSILNRLSEQNIKISAFCEDDDTAPNLIMLKSSLSKVETSTLVTPLSEYLRINNQIAKRTFEQILHLPYKNLNGKLRVYVPVYRMGELLKTILPEDPRLKDCFIYLNTNRENDYSLTIIQKELNVDIDGHSINGFKKYMEYWEENPNKPIILHTQNAIHYNDIVFSDDVRVIISSYDLLKCHYGLSSTIIEEYGTEEQWHYLAVEYRRTKDFESTLCNMLSINKYSTDIFRRWQNYDDNHKWLVWLWSKCVIRPNASYLYESLSRTSKVGQFIDSLYCTIINYVESEKWENYYSERYSLLKDVNAVPPIAFWENIQNLNNVNKIKCLTNLTDREKEEMLNSIQNLDLYANRKLLDICYPELSYYLLPFDCDESINDYFNEYRIAKVKNEAAEGFIRNVYKIAEEHGERIYKFNSRNAVVDEIYDAKSIILFVDALGAEYIPMLEKIFQTRAQVAYCNFPSITSKNNDFFVNRHVETNYELDNWKHANHQYPHSLVKELDIVMDLSNTVRNLFVNYDKVLIVADHGSSRLAVLHKSAKGLPTKGEVKKYKYGRYCEDRVNDYSEYTGCWKEDEYWIFANYDRFIQPGAPINEIHGGATLEEMLVPVMVVSKTETGRIKHAQVDEVKICIDLLTPVPRMSMNKTVTVRFKLSQEIDNVIAVVNNERYTCKLNGGEYSFNHSVDMQSEYTAKIVSGKILGEITYKVNKGISSNLDI